MTISFSMQIKIPNRKAITKLGNVDISRLLPFGTPVEVDLTVKELIREAGSDGGCIMATCNGIMEDLPGFVLMDGRNVAPWTSVRNLNAVTEAARKYGSF